MAISSMGAVMIVEDFSSSANGWGDRDAGVAMAVSYDGGNDWMVGSFASQVFFPLPETDAFMINSGTGFLGNYTTGTPNHPLTQIRFDLYADDVLPSDLFIRLVNGADVFSYQFNLGSMVENVWKTFAINLAWTAGWSGPSESAFNTALGAGGVDQVEIQLTRNGTGFQSFFLDNISITNTPLDGGGSGNQAVPEPNQFLLLVLGGVMIYSLRRASFKRA
jgi:hypothetical protein